MRTRNSSDSFKSIKIPASLLHQLRIIAASRDQYIYQLIASMLIREIEDSKIAK